MDLEPIPVRTRQPILWLLLAPFLLTPLLRVSVADAQELFQQAAVHEQAGEYDPAITAYEGFLAAHGAHELAPVAAMAIANLHFLGREDARAGAEAYVRVTRDYKESGWAAEAARRRGECLDALEEWTAAGEAYREAIALSGKGTAPASADWVNEVSLAAANSFYASGDRGKVIEAYQEALAAELPPQSQATVIYRLADCYESEGQTEPAARSYARLIKEYPFSGLFMQAIGKRELIDQYVQLAWPQYMTYAESRRAFEARDYEAAREHCRQTIAESDNPRLRNCARYGKIVAETVLGGDYTKGSRQLRVLLERLPNRDAFPNAERQLEYFQMVAGMEAEARAHPADLAILRQLGGTYLQSRSSARAIEVLEQARALDARDGQTQLYLGYAYAAAGRDDEALVAFNVYLAENPDDTNALNQIGYTYLGQGDAEAAIPYFERYAAAAPDDPNAHDSLGEGYFRAGRLADAVAQYERAVALDASFTNSHLMLGQIYQQLERPADAAAAYRRFLELVPSGAQAEQAREALTALAGEAE